MKEVIAMLKQGRFSEGQETPGETPEKTRVGRFSDGQESLLPAPVGPCGRGCSCC